MPYLPIASRGIVVLLALSAVAQTVPVGPVQGAEGAVDLEQLVAAQTAIVSKGGKLRFDATEPHRPVIAADLNGARDGNRILEQVKLLSTLRRLRLDGSQVDDKGVLEHLPTLQHLEVLSLGAKISDRGLAALVTMRGLRTLYLGPQVTDVGAARLRSLSRMRTLYLSGSKIGDGGLRHLTGMRELRTLMLAGTAITDRGLEHLARLPRLHTLSVSFTQIQDSGLAELKGLTHLRRLFVHGTRVTPAGLDDLRRALPELNILGQPLRTP
ncbi:MAG: hypothetical protein CMJ59_22615 [Planctomycetaceae bacterium]|nr:hypothetical protein [Planctomycetaceae bacterium]